MVKIDLGGRWTLNKDGCEEKIPAAVPGDVYSGLLKAGQIPDPFYRDNENSLQWIGKTDWRYSREFELDDDVLNKQSVMLVCEGLDTLATVFINGEKIASTDNMFRLWQWDIKKHLRKKNTISVLFTSTIPYIEKKESQRCLPCWGENNAGRFGWVRKQQCNYGWDWGIKAVTCGIWRGIKLAAFDRAKIEDVMITQHHFNNGTVDIDVKTEAKIITASQLTVRVTAAIDGSVCGQAASQLNENGSGNTAITINNPKLWWPNNMGEQPLYSIKIELLDECGNLLDSTTKRIGLRTLRLDRQKDQWGESFRFVVNGQPFFAKGANWIPADGILARMTPQWYRKLVEDAAAVNMNMLRVWGGGIYEDDAFYDACDELGICVWQDFMFACSTYPTYDDDFVANIEAEARYNIKRLHHRACLALWCGNNELEQGLVGDKWTEKTMSWEDYSRVFDKLLPALVSELSTACDYWPGSPHTSVGDRRDFNNPNSGDAHLWDVWHGKKPFEWYRTCEHRFNSEFGFQSFPEPKTVYGYTAEQDRNITSWVMEHHQRSGIGNTTIMQYMLDWFKMPLGFENTLWASQILQGMAIKYACEHWRRSMPRGMGTIYWQLNDTWPVASWSSIDYHGRWKALHYMARKFFAPLLVSGLENPKKGTVEIHITSDMLKENCGVVKWFVCDLEGKTLTTGQKSTAIPPCCDRLVQTLDLSDILADKGLRNVIVWLELESQGKIISENMVLFARPKHLELCRKPGIKTVVRQKQDLSFDVVLTTEKPALWCRLELKNTDANYSDNFVHLYPGRSVTINIKPLTAVSYEDFCSELTAQSIVDTY